MKALPILLKNRQDLIPEYQATTGIKNLPLMDNGSLGPAELRKFIRDMRIKRDKMLQDWN
jgi:hypothetical protein